MTSPTKPRTSRAGTPGAGTSRPALRIALLAVAVVLAALAVAFFLRTAPATSLWPLPDGAVAFTFMAAILGGAAAPLVWIALSGEWAALGSYGLAFGVVTAGMGMSAIAMAVANGDGALAPFGVGLLVLGGVCFGAAAWGLRQTLLDERVTPRTVRLGFTVETAVLTGVGAALILRIPNTLPWPLLAESSTLYGWVFLGLALYYAFSLRRPAWHNARGPLLGFLVYDLVLIGPLLARIPNLEAQFVLGLVAAIAIILVSGALGIWFLFVDPATRDWRPRAMGAVH
jgi:hypothetical protein